MENTQLSSDIAIMMNNLNKIRRKVKINRIKY